MKFSAALEPQFLTGDNRHHLAIRSDLTPAQLYKLLQETGKTTSREDMPKLQKSFLFGLKIEVLESPPDELMMRAHYPLLPRRSAFRAMAENPPAGQYRRASDRTCTRNRDKTARRFGQHSAERTVAGEPTPSEASRTLSETEGSVCDVRFRALGGAERSRARSLRRALSIGRTWGCPPARVFTPLVAYRAVPRGAGRARPALRRNTGDLERLLEQQRAVVKRNDIAPQDDENACFAIIAWVDEALTRCAHDSNPALFAEWRRAPLQVELFNTANAGEEFFDRLARLTPAEKQVIELDHLGFTPCISRTLLRRKSERSNSSNCAGNTPCICRRPCSNRSNRDPAGTRHPATVCGFRTGGKNAPVQTFALSAAAPVLARAALRPIFGPGTRTGRQSRMRCAGSSARASR